MTLPLIKQGDSQTRASGEGNLVSVQRRIDRKAVVSTVGNQQMHMMSTVKKAFNNSDNEDDDDLVQTTSPMFTSVHPKVPLLNTESDRAQAHHTPK